MKLISILTATLLAAALTGCVAPGACDEDRGYAVVEPTRRIVTGDDMDPLPPEEELKIPVASTPPGMGEGCLERPPNYFDRPVGSAAASDNDGG
jgi:hypothetical protein